jgi:hypothetical protein
METSMEKKSKRIWVLVGLVLLMTTIACKFGLPIILPGMTPKTDGDPFLVDPEVLQEALTAEVEDDRPGVMAYLGKPDAFDIAIVEVEGVSVRMESWRYYQFGLQVDFVDGEAVWMIEIEPLPEGTFFARWYDPLDFMSGMTGAEAAQLVATSSPAGEKPQRIDLAEGGEDLAGGSTLVGDQIVIGLHNDLLVYVETIALMPSGGEQ